MVLALAAEHLRVLMLTRQRNDSDPADPVVGPVRW